MSNESTPSALIAEIKLLLQQELAEVKDSMNDIRLEITKLRGETVMRHDLERALETERKKREALEARTTALDKEVTAMAQSYKVYIGIASAIASLVASGLAGLIFKLM